MKYAVLLIDLFSSLKIDWNYFLMSIDLDTAHM